MMNNPMIKWGLYYGFASIAFTIISYFVNKEWIFGSGIAMGVGLLLAIGAVVLAMKEARTEQEGYLGFGEAMKVGLGVFILGTLMSSIFQWVLFNFVDISLIEASKEYSIETARVMSEKMGNMMNMSEEQMEEMVSQTEEQMANMGNPMSLGMIVQSWLLVSLIGGLPLNLIVAAIMKKS
ncbi:MAG: hypothetical protein ACJA01_000002 [Saprospiraceae bacterium]|jgi:hypothetical protein